MAENIAAIFWFIAGSAFSTAIWLMYMRSKTYRIRQRSK